MFLLGEVAKLLIAQPTSDAALHIRRYLIQERQHLLPEKGLNEPSLSLNSVNLLCDWIISFCAASIPDLLHVCALIMCQKEFFIFLILTAV